MKIHSGWNEIEFLEHMSDYMVPAVIRAYRRNNDVDQLILKSCITDRAEASIMSSWKERQLANTKWDERLLDIRQLDIQKVLMVHNEPRILLSFVCQHVDCVRNIKTGEVVDGNESNIQNVFYLLVLSRDFENELFDWKIHEFESNRMLALV